MIVRIMAEDQYRLGEDILPEVQRLDDQLEVAIENNDTSAFSAVLKQLVEAIRSHGEVIPLDEIVSSDIIVPAPDMSLEEAKAHLKRSDPTGTHAQPQR